MRGARIHKPQTNGYQFYEVGWSVNGRARPVFTVLVSHKEDPETCCRETFASCVREEHELTIKPNQVVAMHKIYRHGVVFHSYDPPVEV